MQQSLLLFAKRPIFFLDYLKKLLLEKAAFLHINKCVSCFRSLLNEAKLMVDFLFAKDWVEEFWSFDSCLLDYIYLILKSL